MIVEAFEDDMHGRLTSMIFQVDTHDDEMLLDQIYQAFSNPEGSRIIIKQTSKPSTFVYTVETDSDD